MFFKRQKECLAKSKDFQASHTTQYTKKHRQRDSSHFPEL